MTEPGDGAGAAAGGPGHGQLRASHADRARVTDVLKAAFVEGRLTREELDARVGQASTARTYAELATALMLESRHQPRSGGPPPRRQPAALPPQSAASGGGPAPDGARPQTFRRLLS